MDTSQYVNIVQYFSGNVSYIETFYTIARPYILEQYKLLICLTINTV